MRKYLYMKCLAASMILVLGLYGASVYFEEVPAGEGFEQVNIEGGTPSDAGLAVETEEELLEGGEATPVQAEAAVEEASPAQAQEPLAQESEPVPQESPKAPVEASAALFQDALFIGDSRTVGLMEYGNLGEAEVFASTGMSVFKVFEETVKTASGQKQTLNEVLSARSYGKVYIMLGLNELGYSLDSILKQYGQLVTQVRQYQPEALIFLQANLHVSGKKSASSDIYNNTRLNQLNEGIRALADGSSIFFLDVNPVFDDEAGNLAGQYTADDAHVLGKYYDDWSGWIMEETAGIMQELGD